MATRWRETTATEQQEQPSLCDHMDTDRSENHRIRSFTCSVNTVCTKSIQKKEATCDQKLLTQHLLLLQTGEQWYKSRFIKVRCSCYSTKDEAERHTHTHTRFGKGKGEDRQVTSPQLLSFESKT